MPREAELSSAERAFVIDALRKELRTDGRAPYDLRQVELSFGADFGFCECRLGQTRVAAQVSAEVVRPNVDRPYEGVLQISTEISPMASSVYELGRSSDDEASISRLLEKALRQSNAVDREALCIVAGQKVWSVRVDVHFLDDEGNLLDCACIAAMVALQHFRRPDVTVAGEDVTIHSLEERVPIPLAIHHTPYCLTFAFFNAIGTTSSSDPVLAVLDPSHLEQQMCTGTLTLTLNAQREICVLSKAGGQPIEVETLMRIVHLGADKVRDLDQLVKAALARDAKRRTAELGGY